MSKNRFIDTKFWSDNFVVELNPLEKYLFLYLLTNEHTNIAGIYEIPLRTMAFETGIDKEMLEKMLKVLKEKVEYKNGWLWIKNFEKHQRARGNPNISKGIENIKNSLPDKVKEQFSLNKPKNDRLSKPMDSLSKTPNYLDLDLDRDIDLDKDIDTITSEVTSQVNEIFKIFYETINRNINFGNKTQRKAVEDMIRLNGFENVKQVTTLACQSYGQEYAPVITTPLQLKDKWSALGAWIKKQQDNNLPKAITI